MLWNGRLIAVTCLFLRLSYAVVALETRYSRHFRSHLSPIKPGVLMVRSQTDMKIQAAALTSDQTMCEAKVNLTTDSSTALDKLSSQLRVELYDRNTFNEVIVEVPDELAEHSHCLNISIPQHYSVDVESGGTSSVQIQKLDCDSLNIKMEDGNCEMISMKSLDTNVTAKNINLTFVKPYIGNLTANIREGSVVADKLQGQKFSIHTKQGKVKINSLYAIEANVKCDSGDISINSCHGRTSLNTYGGNINIKSLDGELRANSEQGNVTVHLTQHKYVDLSAPMGVVNVSIPETKSSQVFINTKELDIDDSLVHHTLSTDTKDNSIKGTIGIDSEHGCYDLVVSASAVNLSTMDWLAAQNFSFSSHWD